MALGEVLGSRRGVSPLGEVLGLLGEVLGSGRGVWVWETCLASRRDAWLL